MTPAQFACCTTNASGHSAEAARLVLVGGLTVAAAAERIGLAVQTVHNACTRIRKRDAQIRAAYCGGS